MSIDLQSPLAKQIEYAETDGLPMAENTLQYEYIVTIKGGLDFVFRDEDVFVAGDLFWYPVEGNSQIRVAPDVLVAFGRPKGHRRSYLQWLEDSIGPQVVFEIISPSNRVGEMMRKFSFYEQYGIEEYYIYDPDYGELWGWLRQGNKLLEIPRMEGWVSPRLKVRFELADGQLKLFGPGDVPLATYAELADERTALESERDAAQQRAEKLAAQLKAMGINPEA